jgi:hypothetical protein
MTDGGTVKSVDQLADVAWRLLEEALTTGQVVLTVNDKPEIRIVSTEALVDLATKLSAVKIKKPHVVNTPEGYAPLDTTGRDNED